MKSSSQSAAYAQTCTPPPSAQPQYVMPQIPVRSTFDGGVLEHILYSIGAVFITVVTFGLAYPWAFCMYRRWEINHTKIEGHRLHFDGTGLQLFGNYIKWWCLTIITLGIYSFWIPVKIKKWKVKHIHFD